MFLKKYKNLRQFKPYFRKYKFLTLIMLFVIVTASSMGMVVGFLLSEQMVGITNQDVSYMVKFTILVMAAVIVHHVCWFLGNRFEYVLAGRVATDIRRDVVSKMLDANYIANKDKSSGYFWERLNYDVGEVGLFYSSVVWTIIDAATNCSFLGIIYFLNWQIGLFFTLGISVLLVVDIAKVKKDLPHLQKIKLTTEAANTNLNEIVRGMRDIKGLGIKSEMRKSSGELQETLKKQWVARNTTFVFLSRVKTFLQFTIDACMVLLCAFWLFPTGQITVIVLLIVLNFKGNMYDTVGFVSKLKSYFVQGDYQAGRILEITKNTRTESFGKESISLERCGICVKNLSFGYEKEILLKNISFDIRANSCSVFVGASGSGKSTLFGILSKLLETEDGKIFIGGFDINSFDERSFRSTVCIVNQEPVMFNDTIENNIKIVKPDAAPDEVIHACKRANIHNEILGFAGGYKTLISENGANLSGGQKQRIAIARAILKDTPIILFDESTSALDRENQRIFFDVLAELKQTKTILVIAHKLNSYELFDNVFEIEGGELAWKR